MIDIRLILLYNCYINANISKSYFIGSQFKALARNSTSNKTNVT